MSDETQPTQTQITPAEPVKAETAPADTHVQFDPLKWSRSAMSRGNRRRRAGLRPGTSTTPAKNKPGFTEQFNARMSGFGRKG